MNSNDILQGSNRNAQHPTAMYHKDERPSDGEESMLITPAKGFSVRITGRSGHKFQMNCNSAHSRRPLDARFYCIKATRALTRHRRDHDCDCDFVHLGRRKRITVRPQWLDPTNHLNFRPTKTCLLHDGVGLIVRAAMHLHDQCCTCKGFGDPLARAEPSYPTRATALVASKVLPQFQNCDAKFYMQEGILSFWQQTHEGLEDWYLGPTMYNRHNAHCSRGCLEDLSPDRKFGLGPIDTTPKLPNYKDNCDAPEVACHAILLLQAHRIEHECLCTFEQFVADEDCQQPCSQNGIMALLGLIIKHNARCLRGCFNGKNTATEHIEHIGTEDMATEHFEHTEFEDKAADSIDADESNSESMEFVEIDDFIEEESDEDWDDCSVGSNESNDDMICNMFV